MYILDALEIKLNFLKKNLFYFVQYEVYMVFVFDLFIDANTYLLVILPQKIKY